MSHLRIRFGAVGALVCGLLAAACSASGQDVTTGTTGGTASGGSTSTPSAPSSAGAQTPDFPSATSASSGAASFKVDSALLGVADLSGFVTTPVDGTVSPLPCTPGVPGPGKAYPAAQRGEAAFKSTSGKSAVDEVIYVYNSQADAEKFVAAGVKGFGCTTGKLDGQSIKIVPVNVTTAGTDADEAKRWDILFSDDTLGTATLTRKGSVIIGLQFQATRSGSSEIDPTMTLTKALAKLDAVS